MFLKFFWAITLALVSVLDLSSVALASASSPMNIVGDVVAPGGHQLFCLRLRHCIGETEDRILQYSNNLLSQLQIFNRAVNSEIKAVEVDGQGDIWNYPVYHNGVLQGDCEDIALEKQRRLVAAGFPPSAVLLTIVLTEWGQGHVVLTIRTDQGDLILDILTDEVLPWQETSHTYLKRQSSSNNRRWVELR